MSEHLQSTCRAPAWDQGYPYVTVARVFRLLVLLTHIAPAIVRDEFGAVSVTTTVCHLHLSKGITRWMMRRQFLMQVSGSRHLLFTLLGFSLGGSFTVTGPCL
jgi:hypothetical protein